MYTMIKRPRLRKAIGLLLILGASQLPAGEVAAPVARFSGVLGQSEITPRHRLPFCGAGGVAIDQNNRLWTGAGAAVYCFQRAADEGKPVRWRLEGMVPLPDGARLMLWDGAQVIVLTNDLTLWQLPVEPEDAAVRVGQITGGGKQRLHALAVAPVGSAKGWAQKGRFFALYDESVAVCDPAGKQTAALTLPKLKDGRFQTVLLEPQTGDLIVGSNYPDLTLYRYSAQGKQITAEGWPRKHQADVLISAGGAVWALAAGQVVRLADRQAGLKAQFRFPVEWTYYANGLARAADGSFWVGSSQGITGFSATGVALEERIGGLPQIQLLAAAQDGTLIALTEGGQRWLRLGIDDEPDAPLRCAGNEPWRTGAGWQGRSVAVGCAGLTFPVLDRTTGQLWSFDPWRTAWAEKPWIALTPKGMFTAPKAVAASQGRVWVLDGSRLFESAWGDFNAYTPVPAENLPGTEVGNWRLLAGVDDRTLIAASDQEISAWRRGQDGRYVQLWKIAVTAAPVSALTANERWIAVANGAGVVQIMQSQTGTVCGEIRPEPQTEADSSTISAITLLRDWLVIADSTSYRLLRYSLILK